MLKAKTNDHPYVLLSISLVIALNLPRVTWADPVTPDQQILHHESKIEKHSDNIQKLHQQIVNHSSQIERHDTEGEISSARFARALEKEKLRRALGHKSVMDGHFQAKSDHKKEYKKVGKMKELHLTAKKAHQNAISAYEALKRDTSHLSPEELSGLKNDALKKSQKADKASEKTVTH